MSNQDPLYERAGLNHVSREALNKALSSVRPTEAPVPAQPPTVVHVPIPEGNESRYVEVLREQSQATCPECFSDGNVYGYNPCKNPWHLRNGEICPSCGARKPVEDGDSGHQPTCAILQAAQPPPELAFCNKCGAAKGKCQHQPAQPVAEPSGDPLTGTDNLRPNPYELTPKPPSSSGLSVEEIRAIALKHLPEMWRYPKGKPIDYNRVYREHAIAAITEALSQQAGRAVASPHDIGVELDNAIYELALNLGGTFANGEHYDYETVREATRRLNQPISTDPEHCCVCDRPKSDCACVENGGAY